MAAALLPPLLPTPPRSQMLPILPTPPRSQMLPLLPTPCASLTIPSASSTMPGLADAVERWGVQKNKKLSSPASSDRGGSTSRADSVERWDLHKMNKLSSPASSDGGGSTNRVDAVERWDANKKKTAGSPASSDSGRSLSRADSVDRWDAHKTYKKPSSSASMSSSHSGGSPGRADSIDRWDSHKMKKNPANSTSSSSLESSSTISYRVLPSSEMGDSNKRPLSRASSVERWDTVKKPRSAQAVDAESRPAGDEENTELQNDKTPPAMISTTAANTPVFAGPSFFASPDPSMLPIPTFLLMAH